MEVKPSKAYIIRGEIVARAEDTSAGKGVIIVNLHDSGYRVITEAGIHSKVGGLQDEAEFYGAILKSGIFEDGEKD